MKTKLNLAISGAQGVGKTTLVNYIQNKDKKERIEYFTNVVRSLKDSKKIKINENGNTTTQDTILESHLNNLNSETEKEVKLFDRCLLDWFVFANILAESHNIDFEELKKYEEIFKDNILKYDIIFYLEPEFELVEDGTRNTDPDFQKLVDSTFKKIIQKYNLDVVFLKGSVAERYNQIQPYLDGKYIDNFNFNEVKKFQDFQTKSQIKEYLFKRQIQYLQKNLTAGYINSKLGASSPLREIFNGQNQDKHSEMLYNKMVKDEQLIPRKLWDNPNNFNGTKMDTIFHPHFNLLWDSVVETWKPTSSHLMLASCSGSKPYSENLQYQKYIKMHERGFGDFIIISSPCPVAVKPVNASAMYPNCFYDFPHIESPHLENMMIQNNIRCLTQIILKHKYKSVSITHIGLPYYDRIMEGVKELCPHLTIYNFSKDCDYSNKKDIIPILIRALLYKLTAGFTKRGGQGFLKQRIHNSILNEIFLWVLFGQKNNLKSLIPNENYEDYNNILKVTSNLEIQDLNPDLHFGKL